jgi:hypothetical protein
MPVPQLKSFAEKSGKSLETVEGYWEEAKEAAEKKFKTESPQYWAYVSGIVKKRCGLRESFKEFAGEILLELFNSAQKNS